MPGLTYAHAAAGALGRRGRPSRRRPPPSLGGRRAGSEALARARDEVERREARLESATAEHGARMKAFERREARLKEETEVLGQERAELKALWKNLETEGQRVTRKEQAIETLVARMLDKERASLEEESRKVRDVSLALGRKDKAMAKEARKLEALESDLRALQSKIDARERALEAG